MLKLIGRRTTKEEIGRLSDGGTEDGYENPEEEVTIESLKGIEGLSEKRKTVS